MYYDIENEIYSDQKVSVIIPTYNRSWVLEKAIDSVLRQDYKNIELIVVDDGSVDGTKKILEMYKSEIKVIHQKNSGVSAARNAGIKSASGELIAFLDSDDQWLQGKISTQVDFFDSNPDAVICQTEELWIRNGQKINPSKKHKKISGMIFKESLKLCLVSPSSVMLKKMLFSEVGFFDDSLPACEDYDLWLRISWKYPIFLIDTQLVIKTGGHPDQLSKMTQLDKFRIQSIDSILKSGNLSPEQSKAAKTVLREKCSIYASGCLKRGKYSEAKRYEIIASAARLFF